MDPIEPRFRHKVGHTYTVSLGSVSDIRFLVRHKDQKNVLFPALCCVRHTVQSPTLGSVSDIRFSARH